MPIEIRELVIRVSVSAPDAGGGAAPASTSASASASGGAPDGAARQSLIADCVEQVLHVLRDQRER